MSEGRRKKEDYSKFPIIFYFVVLIFTAVKKLKPCGIHFNFVDFCHDSAKYASIMALAAPKVHQYFTLIFVLIKGAGR